MEDTACPQAIIKLLQLVKMIRCTCQVSTGETIIDVAYPCHRSYNIKYNIPQKRGSCLRYLCPSYKLDIPIRCKHCSLDLIHGLFFRHSFLVNIFTMELSGNLLCEELLNVRRIARSNDANHAKSDADKIHGPE